LVLEFRVGRDQDLKPLCFGCNEQLAVFQSGPSKLEGSGYFVPGQEMPQWRRRALIEEDPHLRGGHGTAGSVLQYPARLLQRDTWKQLDELADWNAVLQVFEKRGDRHACATKDPRSADALGVAFHSQAA